MSDCSLYVISPPVIDDVAAFADQLDQVLSTGLAQAFQLRLKQQGATPGDGKLTLPSAGRETVLAAAEVVLPVCQKHEVAFILNDTPELARECGADGVHIGQEDGSVAEARAVLGADAAVGVTCHASRHLAMVAGEEGADYVAFGAFFPTSSKTPEALAHWGTPTPELVEWWVVHTTVPCVAIGGITPENCRPLVEAGADFIAVITAIWQHSDGPKAGAEAFAPILQS